MEDRKSVSDKPRLGRPTEAATPTMVANVEGFVNKDRRVTLQEVAKQFRISKASAHEILHKIQGMSKVSVRMPKQLTEEYSFRVTISKEHLGRFNHVENMFWYCISLGIKCRFIMLNLKQKLKKKAVETSWFSNS